jgi:pSer/pThr/pTyr-binding forkhead associated (FHA) protein
VSEPVARLIESHSGVPGPTHELGIGVHVLGRDASADVTLAHADVSRHHAELTITADGASIRDLGSKNGVAMNGRKVEQATLEHGSRLAFGELQLLLEHHGDRIDRLLARSGELTVRRPRATEPTGRSNPSLGPSLGSAAVPASRSLLLPTLAAVAFALLLIALLVFG